jgi:MFS family permease
MVVIYTHLGLTPLPLVILVNVLLFVGVTSRMISASALMSAVPDAQNRGAFMAVNSSVQQIAGGIASAAGGLIVVQTATGDLRHYDTLGWVVVVAMLIAMAMLYGIHRAVAAKIAARPEAAPVLVRSA